MKLNCKPKIGLFFIGSKRFRQLGTDTADGSYDSRKTTECENYIKTFSEFADIVFDGVIYERADVDKYISLLIREKVDCVVACYLSWAEDFTWIRFLRDLPEIPVFFTSIVRESVNVVDTNDENQFVEFLSAGSLVGVQIASGSFDRFNRPMCAVSIGSLDEVYVKLKSFSNAAKVRNQLRRSTVGLLACYNEAMWGTYVDPYNMFMKIGPELHFLSVMELFNEINAIPDSVTNELTSEITANFKMMPNVDYDKLKASVRATYAMEQISLRAGVDLLVLNDIDTVLFQNIGLRPGFFPTNDDIAKNMVAVPEGDIGGGLATYILQLISGKYANFIEPFYIDKSKNKFVCGHAGPNNYRENTDNMIVARDERFAKTSYKYAGAPFAWYVFPVGVKTMLHMSEKDGKMKMVCTLIRAIETNHYLASYSHADFVHDSMLPVELFSKILPIGVTQHYGIVDGDHIDTLEYLAGLCGFDFYKI